MEHIELADRFSGADTSPFPDLTTLGTDRQRVLWVLAVGREALGLRQMTPADVEVVLRDGFGLHVPRQRIPGLLADSGGAAVRRRIQGRYYYQILGAGIKALAEVPETVTFVDPSQALTHIRRIETVLAERTGVVHLCDPYVDGRTLDFIAECASASEVRLLTATINKPAPFSRDLKAFRQQHRSVPIEVRQATPGVLHDRYLIDGSSMLIFGTSLNSFSKKQSFVIAAGEDIRRTVLSEFDRLWGQSATVS